MLHCGSQRIPVSIIEHSEGGICLRTEIHDIALLDSDPVAVGNRLHVEFRDGLYEGIARHITPLSGAISVGIEWTQFTLRKE